MLSLSGIFYMKQNQKVSNIKINAILNVIKYALSVIFPLITYPYALRVLGPEGVGKVSYSNSILSYFSLIAMLGVTTYGIREGAKRRNDKKTFGQFADELFSINLVSTLLAYILLVIVVFAIKPLHSYTLLIFIQSISIILTVFGIEWVNTVFEDFLFITIRSIVAQIVSLILLFLTVRTLNDYYNYAMLTIFSNGIICISNWVYCKRYVKIKFTFKMNLFTHFKPLMILFINTLMMTIYVNIDITMLGWIKGDYDVGIYTVAVRVYTILKNIMVAIYAVSIPRLSQYITDNNKDSYRSLYTKMWCCISLVLIPVGAGLISLAEEIMVFMGGMQLQGTGLALQILALSLIFAIFGGLTTSVLNITLGKEKENMIATFFSAILNFALNLYFIPKFTLYGAAFTTLLSELFVFAFCFIRVNDKSIFLNGREIISSIIHAVEGSIIICVAAYVIKQFVPLGLLRIMLIFIFSFILYAISLYVFRDKFFLSIISELRSKMKVRLKKR